MTTNKNQNYRLRLGRGKPRPFGGRYEYMRTLVVIFLLLMIPKLGFACSCGPKDIDHDFEYYEYIFEGLVTSIKADSYGSIYQVELDVSEKIKGDILNNIKVETLTESSACGFNFELGQRYLVLGSEYEFFTLYGEEPKKVEFPTVNSCGSTMKINGNEDSYNRVRERLKYLNTK